MESRREHLRAAAVSLRHGKEQFMADSRNSREKQPEEKQPEEKQPEEKQPGEKPPGKYHYNPGNQSGKSIESIKPESEQENNADRIDSRRKDQGR
jgi:hypothetical protein